MATYAYAARNRGGQLVQGKRRAEGAGELRQVLRDEGLLLVKAKVEKATKRGGIRRVKPKDLILFTFNLHNILDSGVPLLNGLRDMQEETGDPRFRIVVGDILDSVTAGETFSQALAHHPHVFDSHYVNMCRAGEASGRLPHVMSRLMQFLEWREDFKSNVKELITYPTIVVIALIGLVGLVVGFVFPRFASVFDRVNFEMPWSTKFLLGASEFLTSSWYLLLMGAAVLWGGFFLLNRVDRIALWTHSLWLRVPVVGDLVSMLNFGQVANSLASFLDSGIPIPQALEMIEQMVGNRRVALSVREAREGILGGQTLTQALRDAAIFPPLILRLVAMGEQSGRLVDSLEKASRIYDREIPRRTKTVLGILNPAMTIVIGAMLLFVILSIMSPLYRMYQAVGKSY